MKTTKCLGLAAAALLAACGGSGKNHEITSAQAQAAWHKAELYYSFPYKGQQGLSLNTPLVLQFSDPLTSAFRASDVTLQCTDGACVGKGETEVAWRGSGQPPTLTADKRGVTLTPAQELTANSTYCVTLNDVATQAGTVAAVRDFCFSTLLAPAKRGSHAEIGVADALDVVAMFPDVRRPQDTPVLDFSAYRVRFNEPLNERHIAYGDNVKLLEEGELVEDVALLVSYNALTLDPPALLKPGKQYTLEFANLPALHKLPNSDEVKAFSAKYAFTVASSEPRTILIQDTIPASDAAANPCAAANDPLLSMLTEQPLNCVPLDSILLGDKDATMQSGDVFAELAFLPDFAEISPLRVPRGSLLSGSNIKVKLAGTVPAATDDSLDTGEVSVTFISDAVGYISPNPYSDSPNAPKQVRLFMDVAMTAENPVPNAALNQNLLHVELNGMATLEGKSMRVDALGVVEPDVLGVERAFGFLSFQMRSYEPQEQPYVFAEQRQRVVAAPKVISTYPDVAANQEASSLLPGDAIAVSFDKPLDVRTLTYGDTFYVEENGVLLEEDALEWYADGASVVVKRTGGLLSNARYNVLLTAGVTGLPQAEIIAETGVEGARHYFADEGAGQPIAPYEFSFATPLYDDSNVRYGGMLKAEDAPSPFLYPVVLAANPGYPCAMEWAGETATCRGDKGQNGNRAVAFRPQHLPSNRPITLLFSKAIQPISSQALQVFEVADDGSEEPVAGELQQGETSVTFIPASPWQAGQKYKYVLASGCDGGVCGKNGKPLMVAPLAVDYGDETNAFGESVVFFYGAEKARTVFKTLRNSPTLDTAAVMTYHEPMVQKATVMLAEGEAKIPNSTYLAVDSVGGIVTGAKQVCPAGGCPSDNRRNPFAYLSKAGTLSTEILGKATYRCVYTDAAGQEKCGEEGSEALLVGVYPTVLMAGSADLEATVLGVIGLAVPTGLLSMRLLPGANDAYENLLDENDPLANHPLVKGNPNNLIPGWIRTDPSSGEPMFEIAADIYLDAPYLALSLEEVANVDRFVRNIPGIGGIVGALCDSFIFSWACGGINSGINSLVREVERLIAGVSGSRTLDHNMRNYPLNNLALHGLVELMPDGRIRIHQENLNAQELSVSIAAAGLNDTGVIKLALPARGVYLSYESEPVKK